jgi:hypothetical protein
MRSRCRHLSARWLKRPSQWGELGMTAAGLEARERFVRSERWGVGWIVGAQGLAGDLRMGGHVGLARHCCWHRRCQRALAQARP